MSGVRGVPTRPEVSETASFDALDALHINARGGLLAQLIGAFILVLAFFRGEVLWACVAWSGAWVMSSVARWWAVHLYRTRVPGDEAATERARRVWDGSNLLVGAVWGLAALWFFDSGDVPQQMGLTVLVCLVCVVVPASRYSVYLATLALGFGPLMAVVVLSSQPHGLPLAAVLALVYLTAAWLAASYRRAFGQLLGLMRRSEALARLLADETRRADLARRQVEAASADRNSFFVAASHDLRQPLQAMLLFTDALKHQALPAETVQVVDQLGTSARALESLFDDLLDMSQLEAGSVQVRSRPVQLETVYRSVIVHCRPLAFDRGLALDFRGGSRWVHADPVLLERMLRNLVTNAINHTTDGGVLVTCRPCGAEQWKLQVWDTGCGIADTELPRVFEQFYRGAAPKARGLGLGLTIAQAFARLMGASLAVRSALGRGSVFAWTLPRADGAAAADSAPARAQRALASLAGGRYVVVVSGLGDAAHVVELLRAWKADVEVATDAQALAEAWQGQRALRADRPRGLVLGRVALAEQHRVLTAWQRAWPDTPAAVVLMAPADHPAAAWPVLVRLSQPLAAHRLRASLAALCDSNRDAAPGGSDAVTWPTRSEDAPGRGT